MKKFFLVVLLTIGFFFSYADENNLAIFEAIDTVVIFDEIYDMNYINFNLPIQI